MAFFVRDPLRCCLYRLDKIRISLHPLNLSHSLRRPDHQHPLPRPFPLFRL